MNRRQLPFAKLRRFAFPRKERFHPSPPAPMNYERRGGRGRVAPSCGCNRVELQSAEKTPSNLRPFGRPPGLVRRAKKIEDRAASRFAGPRGPLARPAGPAACAAGANRKPIANFHAPSGPANRERQDQCLRQGPREHPPEPLRELTPRVAVLGLTRSRSPQPANHNRRGGGINC